ncbi:hypothetical protein EDB19DRAFT_1918327 [Suillus lakei]|nr:hypothetical protein EDB19DRAFT_1918327 [Suillus lakei]
MAASRIRASISQYQSEAANTDDPSAARIMHFKAGLQWEITTFVTPILQYSAARNIILVIPNLVAHILQLFPQLAWNIVREIPPGLYPAMILHGGSDTLQSRTNYGSGIGYSHVVSVTTSIGYLALRMMVSFFPKQVDETSGPTLLALKWMRERLRTLVEEQQEGIREKMGEIEVYTAILTRLKRGRGE